MFVKVIVCPGYVPIDRIFIEAGISCDLFLRALSVHQNKIKDGAQMTRHRLAGEILAIPHGRRVARLLGVDHAANDRHGLVAKGLVPGEPGENVLEPAQGRGRVHDEDSQEDERLPPAGGWEPSRAGRGGYAGGRLLLVE